MVGISSVGFNLILGFTGAWWNLISVWSQWSAGATPDKPPAAGMAQPFNFSADGLSLDALVARASRELPGYRVLYMDLPAAREGTIVFYGTVPTPNPLRGDYSSRLEFEAPSGTLTKTVDIRQAGTWEKISDSFTLLHYGTFGAAFGRVAAILVKVTWALLGLAPGILAVSGFLIWRARRRRPDPR